MRDKIYDAAWKLSEAQMLYCAAVSEYLMSAAETNNLDETEECLKEVETQKSTDVFVAYQDVRPVVMAAARGNTRLVGKILGRTGWEITPAMYMAAEDGPRGVRMAQALDRVRALQESNRRRGLSLGTWLRPFGQRWEIY